MIRKTLVGRLLAVLAVLLTCTSTWAVGISVNMAGGSANGAPTSVTGVAGVVPLGNWNNASDATGSSPANTGGALKDSNGAAVATSFSWATNGTWGAGNSGNPNEDLMNGYVDVTGASGNTGAFSLTVIPYQRYDIIAYFGSDGNDRTGTISDGTTTYSFNTHSAGKIFPAEYLLTTDTASSFPDANYAIFTGLTSDDITLTLTKLSNNVGLHGFQIINTHVPEPTTAVLALGGLMAIGLRRRRHV